jgi:molybdopterin-synthase adenylyltransferase
MGAAVVGAFQAMQAIKFLVGATPDPEMLAMDFWPWRIRTIRTGDARRPDCPCCGRRQFEFLSARPDSSLTLCGRNAVQIRPGKAVRFDLAEIAARLEPAGLTERTAHLVRCRLAEPVGTTLTVFPDGRTLVQGVTDAGQAKALHARWVGA